jgi:transcriptional regulator with XRE-family HTH domain
MDAAKRIRELLKERKATQTELADFLGCTQSFLSKLLTNKNRITVEMLEKACEFFGITLGDFFQEEGELPLHIENFIAYCKDLSEQEIVALRAVVELFPSKNKTKR